LPGPYGRKCRQPRFSGLDAGHAIRLRTGAAADKAPTLSNPVTLPVVCHLTLLRSKNGGQERYLNARVSQGGWPVLVLMRTSARSAIIRCLSGRGRTRSRRCSLTASISSSTTTARCAVLRSRFAAERGIAEILRQADHASRLHPVQRVSCATASSASIARPTTILPSITSSRAARAARPPGKTWSPPVRLQPAQGQLTPQQARMFPRQPPFAPTVHQLHRNGRLFPPNYLHDSWLDYLYWDTELDP